MGPATRLLILLCFATLPARAYEVDNFTKRDLPLADSLPVMDRQVNEILRKAARDANQESPFHCNRVLLRSQVLSWVRPDPISFLELWASVTDDIQRIEVPFSSSIYAEASLLDAPMMWVAGIGPSFKLNGKLVGADKIGHFFMQGFGYFKRVEEGASIEQVVRKEHGEDGIFGFTTTGVMSYADMAANYSGFKFWSELYSGSHPYFRCAGKTWEPARRFTWKDYVTDAWDEAINCSVLSPGLASRVKRSGFHCPVSVSRCSALGALEHADAVVSPVCREAMR